MEQAQQNKPSNKAEILKELNRLNEHHYIKIQGTEKERLIFNNSDEVFKLFGKEESEVLTPFNDYTYKWLNSALSDFIDYAESQDGTTLKEDLENFRDNIHEYIDNETDIYTSNLTEWLHDNNNNVYYLTEVSEEYGEKDGFKLLQIAQYKAIEEIYNNALSIIEKEFISQEED